MQLFQNILSYFLLILYHVSFFDQYFQHICLCLQHTVKMLIFRFLLKCMILPHAGGDKMVSQWCHRLQNTHKKTPPTTTKHQKTHHVTCNNLMAVFAIIVTVVNVLQVGVSEVNPFCRVIQRQAVGPVELCADYDTSCCPIHKGTFDSRVLTPVWPEHQVGAGKKYSIIVRKRRTVICRICELLLTLKWIL